MKATLTVTALAAAMLAIPATAQAHGHDHWRMSCAWFDGHMRAMTRHLDAKWAMLTHRDQAKPAAKAKKKKVAKAKKKPMK